MHKHMERKKNSQVNSYKYKEMESTERRKGDVLIVNQLR